MITYEKNEIRDEIDFLINADEGLDLSSPELIKKALEVEKKLSELN